jgi:hypothetical protein
LEKVDDLPGLEELKAAGLLDARQRFPPLEPVQAAASRPLDDLEEEPGRGDRPKKVTTVSTRPKPWRAWRRLRKEKTEH